MKFDVAVGNPPYQENSADRNRDDAIYPYFYNLAKKIGVQYCLISPARFLFGVGSTNTEWNDTMLQDIHLKVAYYNPLSSEVFPNTDIKGGVAVLYRNSNQVFGAIDTFTTFEQLTTILQKVSKSSNLERNLSELMYVQTKYNLSQLYEDNKNFKSRLGSQGKERRLVSSTFDTLPEIYFDEKRNDDQVKIYGRQNNKRIYKWVNKKYLELDGNFSSYKVIIPAANGSGKLGETLSTPIIGNPLVGHTQTFISIGSFKTEYEAQSLLKYLKCKFCRTMLSIKKTTQNNKSRETWSKIPLQDFTPSSDIDWTKSISEIDQQLYAKYGLDQSEIDFIESKVKPMD